MARTRRDPVRGQALVEFALVFPIALMVIFGVISVGLWVYFQQQVTNVAREAARFAAIHSSTSVCPTASWIDPDAPGSNYPRYPLHCDGPNNPNDAYPWPKMTDYARGYAWGVNRSAVFVNACWSGYRDPNKPPGKADDPPVTELSPGVRQNNTFYQCTIAGTDPTTDADALGCGYRMTSASDDSASDRPGNQVTVYACFDWRPPLSGFLLIPQSIRMRAVITETIQRQQ